MIEAFSTSNQAAITTRPKAASSQISTFPKTMSQLTAAQLREIIAFKSYRDPDFRRQLLTDPKGTVEGVMGLSLGSISISIVEDTDTSLTMVIPPAARDLCCAPAA